MSARDERGTRAGGDGDGGARAIAGAAMPSACAVSGASVGVGVGAGAGVGVGVNGAPAAKRARSASPARRRVLDGKVSRMRALRERCAEQLAELYFLQAGGNMMDYAAWRKRPPQPQLQAFLEARRPPPLAPPPPDPPPHASTAADEVLEKAKQEAHVARRVAELARAGLWAERRLPRVMEPPRAKSHWDYLLEEMAWLAQDFAHERKWKKQAAKKCARAVHKHFQDKALAAQKAEKAHELQLKKIAAFAAKEIRTFWANVDKLVEWKRVRRVERARKEALDEQLSYIVDRTERYSRQLAANMAPAEAQHTDDEFEPRSGSSDDEETIAAAEREARATPADARRELDALRRESRLELRALLPPGYRPPSAHSPPPSDYGPDGEDSADDEDTIAAQENTERAEDHAAELAALRHDAQEDLEDLVRRYAAADPPPTAPPPPSTPDAGPGPGSPAPDSHSESEAESDASSSSGSSGCEALVCAEAGGSGGAGAEAGAEAEGAAEACAAAAALLQPTGCTLADTAVGTAVPRLLRGTLREYQHVGLHWLATMHARRLNGILADEMGLGKTVQTIALLAHLAAERADWGPHLVVAPTSVLLNWELEFKKWCPAFKLLTYYGTIRERKLKRVGWTKANSFHVCITSYKLVVQDHQSFRRKRWHYLVLDEAQNIKNFKSQRWQLLLNFHAERRLLLTGTPLQNSLLELWSLMHFLMPAVFASHSHFREWFADVAAAAEGAARNDALVRRLHEVLRPFLLRRLKADVERQMPRKYEHVLMCRLAKRQRYLYDDFMARAKTKESLSSGNLLSVINVLMQLRKVCNHPDLFEPRPVRAPLQLPALSVRAPALALCLGARARLAARLGGDLASLEACGAGAFPAHRARHLAPPRRLVEELAPRPGAEPRVQAPAPRPPPARLRLHLRLVPRAAQAAPAPPAPPLHVQCAPPAPPAAPAPAPTRAVPARLERRRVAAWRRLAAANERRCWRLPLYGADLRAAVHAGAPPLPPRDLAALLADGHALIDRFSVCWSAARASAARLEVGAGGGGGGARAWRSAARGAEAGAAADAARAALALLHAPAARQAVAFPHPRLLQYDCGKLQTLSVLLRRLKAGGHRVLVFTQMTRVLDVLEGFLSLHGHAYLRLDGATRVEARQALVERFNGDARVFAMILSTRSGGVGLNLTGADAVVFYDSDWNPTMDAQAQDRAHRIGQTRDVHVYRLVTANTVEENILRKAEQKRALGHMAIDDGHFTTSYLRRANITELFGAGAEAGAGAGPGAAGAEAGAAGPGAGGDDGVELARALAACEDEADAAAARQASAEQHRDLAEFDETLPLEDDQHPPLAAPAAPAAAPAAAPVPPPPGPATPDDREDEEDLAALMKQLTPVEKYAMRLVESGADAAGAERAAVSTMRRQLGDWAERRRRLRHEPETDQEPEPEPEPEPELTYWREDSRAKVWVSGGGGDGAGGDDECMPVWGPPTPPRAPTDVYCERWVRALYRAGAAPDHALPPPRRDPRRDPRRRLQQHRQAPHAPLSLFQRAAAHLHAHPHAAPRQRQRPQRQQHAHAAPPAPPHAAAQPQPEWAAAEDAALRRALRLQRLPAEPPAALAPNWEWAGELVNEAARAVRSARQARDRHDALADPERARRRHRKQAPRRRHEDDRPRPPLARIEALRAAAERRRAQPKRRLDDAAQRNPRHAALLADHGLHYDEPPTPMDIASRRADRIAREKLKAAAPAPGAPAPAAAAAPGPAPPAASPGPGPGAQPPQRVVVPAPAADGARRVRAGAAPAPARAGPAGAAGAGGPAGAGGALLYRQQALGARHHLKILHHAPSPPHAQAQAGAGDGALRTLQLQQLALRRAAPAAASPAAAPAPAPAASTPAAPRLAHSHVVVAHLAPAPPPGPGAGPGPGPGAGPAQAQAPPDRDRDDTRH